MNRQPLPSGVILELDPTRVKPFTDNPRKRFRGIEQLCESIRLVGQVTPIVVVRSRENGFDAELVDGERRLRACLLGKIPVKAVVEGDGKAADRYVRSIAANFCRQGHDAVEIMGAVLALKSDGRTGDEIAGIFGKTRSWVEQYKMLRRLHPDVLEELKVAGDEAKHTRAQKRRRGRLTISVAMLLVPLDQRLQVKAMRGIMAGQMSMAESRTFVHRIAAGSGVRVGSRMTERKKFAAVSTAVENCYQVVERYLKMPGVEVKALVRGATPKERKRVANNLESLCESLLMLADAIEESA